MAPLRAEIREEILGSLVFFKKEKKKEGEEENNLEAVGVLFYCFLFAR